MKDLLLKYHVFLDGGRGLSVIFINLETSVLSDFSNREQTDPDVGLELWENPSWAGPVAPFPQKEKAVRKGCFLGLGGYK